LISEPVLWLHAAPDPRKRGFLGWSSSRLYMDAQVDVSSFLEEAQK